MGYLLGIIGILELMVIGILGLILWGNWGWGLIGLGVILLLLYIHKIRRYE